MSSGAGTVSELNLKYLQASLETARQCGNSLLILNGGSIVALISFLTVLGNQKLDATAAARTLMLPIAVFVMGALSAVGAQVLLYLNSHYAAWGKPVSERLYRTVMIACLLIALCSFAAGAITAVSTIANLRPTL